MHELPVTKSIYKIVRKHAKKNRAKRIVSVHLEIGAFSDLENEWLQKYFDFLSKGSVAEGARLHITRIPALFRCNDCDREFYIESLFEDEFTCAYCHSKAVRFISGKEYTIKNMEAII
jgi:hydrogenase nickel incorporation protein HypA/HybF